MPIISQKTYGNGLVEAVRVGRFRLQLNTMVYFYRLGRTLIDAGSPNQGRFVAEYARKHRIERLLCTHHHEDHAGNGALLQRGGVQVYAPESSYAYLSEGYPQEWYRRVIWGRAAPFTPDHTLEEYTDVEDVGARLRLIATPGHSPDHSCFLEEERGWLFGSDIFVTRSPQVQESACVGSVYVCVFLCMYVSVSVCLCLSNSLSSTLSDSLSRTLFNSLSRTLSLQLSQILSLELSSTLSLELSSTLSLSLFNSLCMGVCMVPLRLWFIFCLNNRKDFADSQPPRFLFVPQDSPRIPPALLHHL
jgi:Metallo-beta-lactamase superfamily